MLKAVFFALSVLVTTVSTGAAQREPHRVNCGLDSFNAQPMTPGPARLSAVNCRPVIPRADGYVPPSKSDSYRPLLSPDGRFIAESDSFGPEIAVLPMTMQARPLQYRVRGLNRGSVESIVGERPLVHGPSRWNSDSRSLWSVIQPQSDRGNWLLGPMRPVVARGGTVRALPAVVHPSGPLVGLRWVNGDGLALGQFGMLGPRFRPRRSDRDPAYATFDARTGAIRNTLRLRDVADVANSTPSFVETTVLDDGRVRTYFGFGGAMSVLWTEGNSPRRLRHHLDTQEAGDFVQGAMSVDGRLLLIDHGMMAGVGFCDRRPGGVCPPPRAREGTLASLFDLESGQRLWTIDAREEHSVPRMRPALSPDNRYGLLQLPFEDRYGPQQSILVSLTDGSVVQTLPVAGTAEFVDGGRTLRIIDNRAVIIYAIAP